MAFMAVGAYTTGILGRFAGFGVLPGVIAGALMAGVFGLIIGWLTLRLRRTYLALFTIAYAEIVRLAFAVERQWTNGPDGLELTPLFPTTSKIPPYYAHLALLVVSLVLMSWLASSRFGLFLRAIREDEEAAAAMGVHVVRYKVLVFVITSMIAGLAGAMQWHYVQVITPNTILILQMSIVITMAVLGGIENLFAAAIGAIIIWISFELLRAAGNWRWVVFGILLMITLRFFQNGLFYPVLQLLFRRDVAEETVAKRQLAADGEATS
jgi:branched-chain amino acid transport system permease protein